MDIVDETGVKRHETKDMIQHIVFTFHHIMSFDQVARTETTKNTEKHENLHDLRINQELFTVSYFITGRRSRLHSL